MAAVSEAVVVFVSVVDVATAVSFAGVAAPSPPPFCVHAANAQDTRTPKKSRFKLSTSVAVIETGEC